MSDPFIALARARQYATGSSLDVEPPNLTPACETESDFSALVIEYYLFFNEAMAKDVKFLERSRPNASIEALRRLIYNLRTAIAHDDNPTAKEAAALWRKHHHSPQEAASALAERLSGCLELLSRTAIAVSRNQAERAQWQELLSVDVATVFSAVATDLGLSFTEGNRRRMVRLVEKRLQVQPRYGDRRIVVADYCAQEILADRRPLPVPYDKILDVLGLIGTSRAPGAILAAHSVAEISPRLDGAAFIARVEATWRVASGHSPTR